MIGPRVITGPRFWLLSRSAFLGQRVVLLFSSGESGSMGDSEHNEDREGWSGS